MLKGCLELKECLELTECLEQHHINRIYKFYKHLQQVLKTVSTTHLLIVYIADNIQGERGRGEGGERERGRKGGRERERDGEGEWKRGREGGEKGRREEEREG